MSGQKRALLAGKVAQILNERELVINIGRSAGVQEGMEFSVMATEDPIEVLDPDSGEILDTIDREKVKVEAAIVKERITICRTKSFRTRGGSIYQIVASHGGALNPPRTIHETLSARKEDFPAPIDPDDSFVKIGDKVLEVRMPVPEEIDEMLEE